METVICRPTFNLMIQKKKHLPNAVTLVQHNFLPALAERFESPISSAIQVNTRRLSHDGLILIQRYRLETNIKPAFLEWGDG